MYSNVFNIATLNYFSTTCFCTYSLTILAILIILYPCSNMLWLLYSYFWSGALWYNIIDSCLISYMHCTCPWLWCHLLIVARATLPRGLYYRSMQDSLDKRRYQFTGSVRTPCVLSELYWVPGYQIQGSTKTPWWFFQPDGGLIPWGYCFTGDHIPGVPNHCDTGTHRVSQVIIHADTQN